MEYEFNECQSSLEELKIYDQPKEIQEQFFDFLNNVPFIQWMVSKDRPHAKDLPRDEKGRIIFDVVHPPILDNMDYFRQEALYFDTNGYYSQLRPNPNPNSEYRKFWDKVLDRSWNGMVRESDGMWIPGDMYFYLNFDPIIQTKIEDGSKRGRRIIDFPECWDGVLFRYFYIYQAQNGGLYDKTGGLHGCEISSRGKAHPYSQEVYTPEGLKLWKDVKVGDFLFGDDGKLTKVIDIPFDDVCDVYEITFKDGRKVKASGNHLWKVFRRYSHCFKIMSTKEMLQDFGRKRKPSDRNKGIEYIYAIPSNNGVDWGFKPTKIDPYTMGLCLGDGCFRTEKLQNNIYYTSTEEDMCTYLKYIPYDIVKLKTEKGYFIRIANVRDILQSWGLHMKKSEDKFIPEEYKFNSREVRLNLLKGLMDSDGFVDSNGIPIIGVSSKKLADDIAFIARSLGYNCLQSVKKTGYKKDGVYKECLDNHIVRIYTSDRIFNLERKYNLISKFESAYSRSNRDFSTIVDIKPIESEICKCVTVDNESHCYLIGDFVATHNSKSYSTCSMMAKRFVIGESKEVSKQVKCLATAYQKQYLTTDGILNKFQSQIDFLAQNTPFPNKRLKSSLQDMSWTMGYVDLNTGTRMGTLNEVSGLSAKDDPGKVRGKRQNLIVVEEFGSFANVLEMYNIMRPSVEEGNFSFGQMYLIGTAGEDESDFQGAQEIVYNPKGYKMYALPNVYDKLGQGRKEITYFFPGYLSRKGCYDKNGNSNVTKALLEILVDRYTIKYNSSDINSITRAIAEIPITPQEAITRTKGNIFPVTMLNERINEIDNNPNEFDSAYVGNLIQKADGTVEFSPSVDIPIREFPTKDNKAHPYDTKIYTSNGIKKWGDIKIGDKLINTNGGYTTVIDIPFDGITDVYELTLKDGRKIKASGNHKWSIIDTNGHHKILSTKEMFDNGWYRVCKEYKEQEYRNLKYFIPKNNGADYNKQDLPINPYLLGLMLGDGCICGSTKNRAKFTASLEDMETYKTILYYKVNTMDDRHHYIHIDGIKDGFVKLGLENTRSNTKFIPNLYKFSSREDRLELLRGLCDTDGTIEYGGNVGYTTVSKQLAEDTIELARSLGINCNMKSVHINNRGNLTYTVIFYTQERLFHLERKYSKQRITKNRAYKTGIYDIKYIGKEKCKCVTVDSEDSCYLIGDYITTHNCKGAIEIFEMPKKDSNGKVFENRYILGHDPVDNDGANTMSLSSTFVLDLFTDRIVAEYTGRQDYADDNFEIVRLLCLFYNGRCLYENNKRGIFAYFSMKRCLHLLADTPEYLIDKQIVKSRGYGNSAKGVAATTPVNNYANERIKEWLIKPVVKIVKDENGNEVETVVPNLAFIRNRALLKELVLFNPNVNVDRIRALGMVMLYRGQFMDLYEGDLSKAGQQNEVEEDDYFKGYDEMKARYEHKENII